jgi:hypothetical protein
MKLKLKDNEFTLCKIKITKIRFMWKDENNLRCKDKMWVAEIDHGNYSRSFNATNKREFWRLLREEIRL